MKKGTDTERRTAITNQTGPGSRGRRKFRSNAFLKSFSRLYTSFGFLFSDSPYDLSYCENLMGKKSINNLGIKVSWTPFMARLALKRV